MHTGTYILFTIDLPVTVLFKAESINHNMNVLNKIDFLKIICHKQNLHVLQTYIDCQSPWTSACKMLPFHLQRQHFKIKYHYDHHQGNAKVFITFGKQT